MFFSTQKMRTVDAAKELSSTASNVSN